MNLLTAEQRKKVVHVASDFLKDSKEIAGAIDKAGVKNVDCKY